MDTGIQPSGGGPRPRPEVATLGGGCFWCTETVFKRLRGVTSVESGYSGGDAPNPTYEQVCRGDTGHAEVVRIEFDPTVLPFADLLEVFFATHDPTTLNRQGADVGTKYRSVIFYHTPEQRETAERVISELTEQRVFDDPIVTEISPARTFYAAEEYHRDYYERNRRQPYCEVVIAPKVAKLRSRFAERLAG